MWVLLSHPVDLTYEIKLIIVCPCTNKKDLNMGYKVIIETEDGRKLTTNTPSHQKVKNKFKAIEYAMSQIDSEWHDRIDTILCIDTENQFYQSVQMK